MSRNYLTLYQVGDVVVHALTHQEWPEHASKMKMKAKPLGKSHRYVFCGNCHHAEPHQYRIQGVVTSQDCASTSSLITRLEELAGCEVDLIAYGNLTCCEDAPQCNCITKQVCNLVWFQTRGFIEDIKLIEERPFVPKISFTMTTEPYWYSLDRLLFRYTDERYPPYAKLDLPFCGCDEAINPLPSCEEILQHNPCNEFLWTKLNYCDKYIGLDPAYWQYTHKLMPPGFWANTGFGEGFHVPTTVAHIVNVPQAVYSAPPMSIYAFERLRDYGTISIEVQKNKDVWSSETQRTTIDLAATNQRLVDRGYGGFTPLDVIYVGDVPELPGFILRYNTTGFAEKLPDCFPVVNYPGEWPGQLSSRRNRVSIICEGDTRAAYNHIFRRL